MYILAEESTKKQEKPGRDAPITAEQRSSLDLLFNEANGRTDLGVGEVWRPTSGNGTRPSAIYARGVTSLSTCHLDLEAIAKTQPRVKSPVQHFVVSLNEQESRTISDEDLIKATESVLDKAGFGGHGMIISTHTDTMLPDGTGNRHAHAIVCSVSSVTLRAFSRTRDYFRLHHALRSEELARGWKDEHGLAVVRDRGLKTERIEWATPAQRAAWKAERRAERLEDMARSFLSDEGGLESEHDRRDRIVYAIREHLAACVQRKERPLQSDLHVIAARLCATIENDPFTGPRIRLMERAEEGKVTRYSKPDAFGETQERFAKWVPTDTTFALEAEQLAPSPLDGADEDVRPTAYDRAKHELALEMRKWLRGVGSAEDSEREVVAVVREDPGRISRDLIAGGAATFTAEDFDRWTSERVSGDWGELSEYAMREDQTLVTLSPDTAMPLLTTQAQLELEQDVHARATRLAQTPDPSFDRETMIRAMREVEAELSTPETPFKFTFGQLQAFGMMRYRFGVANGEAGSGKSSMLRVIRRYCEMTGREVVGFATSQMASEVLAKRSGIESVNTARAQALEVARGEKMIPSNSYAIIDEHSMLGMDAAQAALTRVEQNGASVLFIGDLAQLPTISAGDTGRVLTDVAKTTERYTEVTRVFRQSGDLAWMRQAVPAGGKAIRENDPAAFRAYLEQFVDRGHVVFHDDRKSEVAAKAADVVAAVRRGERVIATGFSRIDCLHTNRAIRAELGLEGQGMTFRVSRGVREFAAGDRIVFEKNAERTLGVLNGYAGTVTAVGQTATGTHQISVALDGGKVLTFDPDRYRDVDYGWCVTTHKSQGRGEPLAIPTLAKNDDARSAHVALTRCETGLRVHTRMTREELIAHLCSPNSLQPRDDALLFDEIVRRTGGPDTYWATAVRDALAKDSHPLRQQHRAEMKLRTEARDRDVREILTRKAHVRERLSEPDPVKAEKALKRIDREERKQLAEVYERHALESFVGWATRRKLSVEEFEELKQQKAARNSERIEVERRMHAAPMRGRTR